MKTNNEDNPILSKIESLTESQCTELAARFSHAGFMTPQWQESAVKRALKEVLLHDS